MNNDSIQVNSNELHNSIYGTLRDEVRHLMRMKRIRRMNIYFIFYRKLFFFFFIHFHKSYPHIGQRLLGIRTIVHGSRSSSESIKYQWPPDRSAAIHNRGFILLVIFVLSLMEGGELIRVEISSI